MYSLSDLYEKGSGSTAMTIIMGVVASLFFTTGLFLIVSSHSNSQSNQLEQAIATVRKALGQSGNSSAALLNLEAALAAQKGAKPGPVTIPDTTNLETLNVKGATSLQGNVRASRDVAVGGNLSVTGNASVLGDFAVSGAAEFADTLDVGSDLQVTGDADITGDILATNLLLTQGLSVGTDLDVTGGAALSNSLTVGGSTSIGDSLDVGGRATLGAGLDVAGSTTIGGNLSVTGTTTLLDSLDVTGAVTLQDALEVTGTSTFASLNVAGATVLDGSGLDPGDTTLEVTGATLLQTTLGVTGGTISFGNVNVGGAATITATTIDGNIGVGSVGDNSPFTSLTVNAELNGSLTLSQGYASVGSLDVSAPAGNASITNSSVEGSLTVSSGGASVGGDLSIGTITMGDNGTLSVNSQTVNTSITGNLIVSGASSTATIGGNVSASSVSLGETTLEGGSFTSTGGTTVNGNLVVGDGSVGDLTAAGNIVASGSVNGTEFYTPGHLTAATYVSTKDLLIGNNGNITVRGAPTITDTCPGHFSVKTVIAGLITDGSCQPGVDLAENFPSSQSLEAGEVVSIDPANSEHVIRSSGVNDNSVIGVVSTEPGITLGQGQPGYPIALAGRVPVKVTNEGGAIAPGDYLTSSSTPGYAKKAALGEKTIGQALASFNGTSGTVITFVNISGGNQAQQLQVGNGNFTSLNVSGPTTLTGLEVTGLARIQDLQVVGTATIEKLNITGHVEGNDDTRGTVIIPAGQTTFTKTFNKPYSKAPAIVASPDNQPASFSATATNTGFEIKLAAPMAADVKFNYLIQE